MRKRHVWSGWKRWLRKRRRSRVAEGYLSNIRESARSTKPRHPHRAAWPVGGTQVVQSFSDPEARLYYRHYVGTRVGNKWLSVVVEVQDGDAFILTAYLTDKIKQGVRLWPSEH